MPYRIELYRPHIFDKTLIKAWFTYKNIAFSERDAAIPGLNLGFNTSAPQSEIIANRKILADAIVTPVDNIAYLTQVHGSDIAVVETGGPAGEFDGLITAATGVVLAIQVADCAAVLLADIKQRIVAAVHAGWRGAARQIIPKALSKMAEMGCEAENIRVFISPCISVHHFEVGEEVARQFPERFVNYTDYEKPHVNLKEFIEFQLTEFGINKNSIETSSGCTIEDAPLYYSYRREKERSGRMMALIKIAAPE